MDVPRLNMNNGHSVPAIGLGTWQAQPGEVEKAVKLAIDLGYRHFDCARVYGNEAEVGSALQEKIKEGTVRREDLFVVSKLWNTHHNPEVVVSQCKITLDNFGLDYLDLYLMHWPFAFKTFRCVYPLHEFSFDVYPMKILLPGYGGETSGMSSNKEGEEYFPRDESGKIIFADYDYVDTWKAMEKCVELGLTKSIGLSNFNSQQIERVLNAAKIKPVMNQVETHPYLNQKKLNEFCNKHGILITGYSPLGSSGRPWGKPEELHLLSDKRLNAVASRLGKTPAQVSLRYLVQQGVIPIPKSTNPNRLLENIDIFNFQLSPEDMKELDEMNCNYRYCQFRDAVDHKDHPFQIEF